MRTQYVSPADEKAGLSALVRGAITNGVRFLSDRDADAGVTPRGDPMVRNGNDAVKELERESAVRDVLLAKFSDNVIATGDPMWMLNERLVPGSFTIDTRSRAPSRRLEGMEYTSALRGDTQIPAKIVDPARQREALTA